MSSRSTVCKHFVINEKPSRAFRLEFQLATVVHNSEVDFSWELDGFWSINRASSCELCTLLNLIRPMVNMEYHSFPLSCRHVSAVVLDWRGKEHKLISYQFYCSRKLLISGQLTQIHLVVRLIHHHPHLLHLCSLSCSYFRLSSHCHRRVFWSWKYCTRSTACCFTYYLLTTWQWSPTTRWRIASPSPWTAAHCARFHLELNQQRISPWIFYLHVMFSLFHATTYHLPQTASWCDGDVFAESMWPILN